MTPGNLPNEQVSILEKAGELEITLRFSSNEEGSAFDKAMMAAEVTRVFWDAATMRTTKRHPLVAVALADDIK